MEISAHMPVLAIIARALSGDPMLAGRILFSIYGEACLTPDEAISSLPHLIAYCDAVAADADGRWNATKGIGLRDLARNYRANAARFREGLKEAEASHAARAARTPEAERSAIATLVRLRSEIINLMAADPFGCENSRRGLIEAGRLLGATQEEWLFESMDRAADAHGDVDIKTVGTDVLITNP